MPRRTGTMRRRTKQHTTPPPPAMKVNVVHILLLILLQQMIRRPGTADSATRVPRSRAHHCGVRRGIRAECYRTTTTLLPSDTSTRSWKFRKKQYSEMPPGIPVSTIPTATAVPAVIDITTIRAVRCHIYKQAILVGVTILRLQVVRLIRVMMI